MNRNHLLTALAVACAAAVATPVHGMDQHHKQSTTERMQEGVSDFWIDGKLEAIYALNNYLNPFDIDTDVNDGVVRLTGSVESEVHRNLATDLARGVEGVRKVDNQLRVEPKSGSEHSRTATTAPTSAVAADTAKTMQEARHDTARTTGPDREASLDRDFGQWVSDVTTTAMVKSKLFAEGDTEGLEINVDTVRDVVTLRGEVDSEAQRKLAAEIAAETGDVAEVRSELKVRDEPTSLATQ